MDRNESCKEFVIWFDRSHSARGAWIETLREFSPVGTDMLHSARGAWIETCRFLHSETDSEVKDGAGNMNVK